MKLQKLFGTWRFNRLALLLRQGKKEPELACMHLQTVPIPVNRRDRLIRK